MKNLLALLLIAATSLSIHAKSSGKGIAESSDLVSPILPGMTVANTCLQDIDKNKVCTDEIFAEQPTVLVVYRGGWCPYCNAQLNSLKKIENNLKELGYQIIAMSPDSNKSVKEQQKRENLSYTLLTDNEMALSQEMGLAFFLDKKTEKMYRDRLGVPFVDINGDERVSLPVPAVYLIDKNTMVHFQYVNPNFRVRLDERVLLVAAQQALKAMKKPKS